MAIELQLQAGTSSYRAVINNPSNPTGLGAILTHGATGDLNLESLESLALDLASAGNNQSLLTS